MKTSKKEKIKKVIKKMREHETETRKLIRKHDPKKQQ